MQIEGIGNEFFYYRRGFRIACEYGRYLVSRMKLRFWVCNAHYFCQAQHTRYGAAIYAATYEYQVRMQLADSQHLFPCLSFIIDGNCIQDHSPAP